LLNYLISSLKQIKFKQNKTFVPFVVLTKLLQNSKECSKKIHFNSSRFIASLFNSQKLENLVKFVNPIIGTEKMGHTFPGATVPFGAVQLSPETDTLS
jgi:putative alpha-1,2-mannosidase